MWRGGRTTLLFLSHFSQARLCLLGSRRSHGRYHCPDFHSHTQVLISCIIHLPALAAVISSLHSPCGAPPPVPPCSSKAELIPGFK